MLVEELQWHAKQDVQVNGYAADKLDEALEGVKVVVIPAGVPRKVRSLLSLSEIHANVSSLARSELKVNLS